MITPAVSVLIPCKNGERFLGATLESALRQTLPPLEVIVVDDGSTDHSREIAASFGSAITVSANPGRGVSSARQHALGLSRGAFIQYLDADDLLAPHANASRTEALEREDAEIAVSDWQRMVFGDGGWTRSKIESGHLSESAEPADARVFATGFWAPPAAILYRRSVCERIGGWSATLPVIQDARYLFDAARVSGRFVHVPEVGAYYRQHGGASLSTADPSRFWADVLQNAKEIEQIWRADHRLDERLAQRIAGTYAACAAVGLRTDRDLYERSRIELDRFPTHRSSAALRTGLWLAGLLGYSAGRWLARAPGWRSRL